ncbi:hypothetical protein ALT785_770183 [Alteromonas infernus]
MLKESSNRFLVSDALSSVASAFLYLPLNRICQHYTQLINSQSCNEKDLYVNVYTKLAIFCK